MHETSSVPTADGPARLHVSAPDGVPHVVLVVGGGASGQVDTADLTGLADALPGLGFAVARVELPWRVAGRRVGPRPPASDPAWVEVVAAIRLRWPGVAVVTGGRSAGARIACRTWAPDVAGVVALSFPLHPPGRPGVSRAGELAGVGVPVLLVSGARDPFGTPEELSGAIATGQAGPRRLEILPGATHSFPARVVPRLTGAVAAFLADTPAGPA